MKTSNCHCVHSVIAGLLSIHLDLCNGGHQGNESLCCRSGGFVCSEIAFTVSARRMRRTMSCLSSTSSIVLSLDLLERSHLSVLSFYFGRHIEIKVNKIDCQQAGLLEM